MSARAKLPEISSNGKEADWTDALAAATESAEASDAEETAEAVYVTEAAEEAAEIVDSAVADGATDGAAAQADPAAVTTETETGMEMETAAARTASFGRSLR